jgi:hypothetical protein
MRNFLSSQILTHSHPMAIDFIVNYSCKAKKDLDDQGIIHLVKSKQRAEALLQRFLDQGMRREEAMNARFGIQKVNPSGAGELEMVTVGSLFKQAELLDDYREACLECPASGGTGFGCYQSVNYPISEVAEEWIAKMAAKAISAGMPNNILVRFILDQQVKGETFAKMRGQDNRMYTESEFPIEIEVEQAEGGPLLIDTNQILDMFFAVGEMGDVHQQFLLFFSGGLTIQDAAPDMSKIGIEYQVAALKTLNGPPRYWVYRMPDQLSDDRSIRQIKAFLRAVFAAQGNQATLTIDC